MDHDKLRNAIKAARKEPTTEYGFLNNAWSVVKLAPADAALLADAAESTLPRTKMVEVWHVHTPYRLMGSKPDSGFVSGEYEPMVRAFKREELAQKAASYLREHSSRDEISCIRVTGPHLQEVPA